MHISLGSGAFEDVIKKAIPEVVNLYLSATDCDVTKAAVSLLEAISEDGKLGELDRLMDAY